MRIGLKGNAGRATPRPRGRRAVSATPGCGNPLGNGERRDLAETLNDEEVDNRLKRLAWEREGDEIVREWRFEDFGEAIAFVNRVAELAEEANHHPDIFVHGWNKVKLSLINHSAGGLTDTDFEMATRFDGL